MSNVGNLSSAQSSSIGIWCEAICNQNISITANSNVTATFVAPIAGSGSYFTSNTYALPVAVTLLTNTNYNSPAPNIQGANTSILQAGGSIGITGVFQNSAGLNVSFNNVGGATANVNTNSRLLFVFNQGI
jgi:hypothetical protein